MSVTVDDLALHLGFVVAPSDSDSLQRALDTATALIVPHCRPETEWTPPQTATADLATLTVAGDLWRRKDAPGGTYGFADGMDYATTLPRDPLISVWAWLVESGLTPGIVVA